MGKKIDAFVLSALAAAGLFFYFDHTFENNAAAILLAGVSFLLLRRLFRLFLRRIGNARWLNRRRMRRESLSTIMQLACEDAEDANNKVASLIRKVYGKDYTTELVQLHPSDCISAENIFERWKKHRGEDRLVICATCKCSADVRIMCESMKQPQVALVDAGHLSRMIAVHPEGIFINEQPAARKHLHFSRIAMLLFNRKNAPRSLLFSVSMLLLYLLGGNNLYLLFSMLLLFSALASLHRTRIPAKLF